VLPWQCGDKLRLLEREQRRTLLGLPRNLRNQILENAVYTRERLIIDLDTESKFPPTLPHKQIYEIPEQQQVHLQIDIEERGGKL
jgi:hypothetical protein